MRHTTNRQFLGHNTFLSTAEPQQAIRGFITLVCLFLFVLFANLLLSSPALAELKIGYVDMQALMRDIPQTAAGEKALKEKFVPLEKELREQGKAFEKEQQEFQKNQAVMSQEQQQQALATLRQKAQTLQQQELRLRGQVDKEKQHFFRQIENQLQDIIKRIARVEKYDFVHYNGVAYANEKYNLTPSLVKEMKKIFQQSKDEKGNKQ